MSYYIIVFMNTHTAMSGEKKLQEIGINFRIMPTPTAITQSCGICIRIEDEETIREIIDEDIIQFKGVYKRENGGYELIK